MLHPSPKQLISFSARNLRESLRGPQPFQLFFVSRRPARPAVPPPRGCAKGPQPLRLPSAGGGVYPAEERFFYPAAHKKRKKPHAPSVPETAYLLFSRESLRGPQPFQLSFVSRRPARPAVPPSRGCAKGPQPLRLPSAGGGVYPAEERFFHPSAHKKRMKPNAPSVPETSADGKSLPLHQNPCAATPCADFDAPSRKRRLPLARFQLI